MDDRKQLEVDSLVADCALYKESNLKLMSQLRWLCRVPLSIKSAQTLLISILPESELTASKLPGYKWAQIIITYAGIEQRWLLVESAARKESDLRKLSQKVGKAAENAVKEINKLPSEKFAGEADAIKALSKLAKSLLITMITRCSL
ncbi:hypothetical protein QUA81_32815 [Microcoleus sp. F6_B4]